MLIDLDVPPAEEDRPERDQSAGKIRYGLIVVVALLLLPGGAVPPSQAPGLVAVASTDGYAATGSLLTGNALYTVHRGGRERSLIRARPLYPGGPRWTVEVSGGNDGTQVEAAGDVLIVNGTFRDAATGLLLWKAPDGALLRVIGNRVAVAAGDTLRMADLHTGRTLWSRRTGEVYGLDADGSHVVTFDYSVARASVYDAATGRRRADRVSLETEPDLFGADPPEPFAAARVVGSRLYVYGTSQLQAFAVPDLRYLGTVELPGPALAVQACGDMICTTGPGTLSVFSPDATVRLWTDRQWSAVTRDSLVVADDGRTLQVDIVTGRVERELGRGGPVGDLMLRVEADRTWVTRIRDGRVLGAIPSVAPRRCTRAGDYLACPTTGSTVAVWRVPS